MGQGPAHSYNRSVAATSVLAERSLTLAGSPSILIDGYNLLHASGVFGTGGRTSLESSREALLDWLGNTLGSPLRERTTIVFDARQAPPGLPRVQERHGLTVLFAPRASEADDLLEQLIREHSAPRSLTVVSSDHRIHRAGAEGERRRSIVSGGLPICDISRTRRDWITTASPNSARKNSGIGWKNSAKIENPPRGLHGHRLGTAHRQLPQVSRPFGERAE